MESDLGKLFIGGISWDTDEDSLKEYFSTYGDVVETVIMRDRVTGRARGFGFVVFTDPAVAERVIMEKHMIDGRAVEAKKAVPKDDQQILNRNNNSTHSFPGPGRTKKIFVGGLASTVTEGDFKKYFDQFGTITDVVVMYDHNTQRPRGFGFITYDFEEAVDRVLHKTFHELNGKLVEVKRAVPKELFSGANQSPLIGSTNGLSRNNSFLNHYTQGYSMSPIGGYGVTVNSRFSPVASGLSELPPFGSTGYGVAMEMEPCLSPGYGGSSNIGNSLGYGRQNPYNLGNSRRYSTPIGYSRGNERNKSFFSSPARNVWGGGVLNNASSSGNPDSYLGTGNRSFEVSFGDGIPNWGLAPVSALSGGSASGYAGGGIGYGNGGSSYALEGGSYGRNNGITLPPTPSFAASSGVIDGSYGDLYHSASVYGNSTWRATSPDQDGAGSFDYGIGNVNSDVPAKSSEGYIEGYSVSSRQPNRGIAA